MMSEIDDDVPPGYWERVVAKLKDEALSVFYPWPCLLIGYRRSTFKIASINISWLIWQWHWNLRT